MEAEEARLGVEDGEDGGRRKCVGVGHDLSPHYLHRLATFISHNPGTELGSPGQYQVVFSFQRTFHLRNYIAQRGPLVTIRQI